MALEMTDKIKDKKNNLKDDLLNKLFLAMINFNRGDPKRIQHFTKVHSFARLISQGEGLEPNAQFTLEVAAYVHDIGIRLAEEKYGYENGKLQEELGPAAARKLMEPLGFSEEVISRVEFLVSHHHTYTNINSLDYQILVEADFLVNLYENSSDKKSILAVKKRIFRTKTGLKILNDMFALEATEENAETEEDSQN